MIPQATSAQTRADIPFDFAKAVAEAKRDYPAETRNITFIDIDAPDAPAQYAAWMDKLKSPQSHARAAYSGADKLTADMGAFAMGFEGHVVVAVHGQKPDRPAGKAEGIPQGRWLQYVFDHELGHAIVKGGMKDGILNPPPNFKESIADSFAVLRGLRNGTLDRSDIREIADARVEEFMTRQGLPQQHLTTMALDALVINPKQIDFCSLSNAEIKAVARDYAKAFSNDQKTNLALIGSKFCHEGGRLSDSNLQSHVKNLVKLAETAPPESSAFYIALRALKTPLAEKTLAAETTAPAWRAKLQELQARAPARDVGAEKALENTAPAAAPAGLVDRVKRVLSKPRI